MRILHVINSTDPAGGGPIESIIQAHYAQEPEGHTSEIACMDDSAASWLEELPMIVHALGPAKYKYRYAPRFAPWLAEHASRFDCVIVHGIWLYPSLGTWRTLRNTDTPYFVYTHGMMDPTFRTLFPGKHAMKTMLWKLAEHRVMDDARAVFFTCEEERNLAHSSFKPFACDDAIVPYCVGEPPGDATEQKKLFLEKFPHLSDRRIILFLSRIHKKKGCDLLLEAFSEVAAMDITMDLVVAGPDSTGWQQELQTYANDKGIANRITWTGMLSGDLKWGAFRAADVFVLPSHQENFGIAVVESLACSLPVIITDRINIWREVQEDDAGIVTKVGADETAAGLKKWLQLTLEQKDEMRQNAAQCFASRFRSDIAAKNLLTTLGRFGVKSG